MTGPTETSADGRDDAGVATELSRDMGLADITFIGVGAMIGAGIFALTGFAAGIAGPALTVAFLINGFVALFTAMSYAELGGAFPEAGGGYLWVEESLVEPNGFYAGWMSWFAHAVACALYAVTFGTYFTEFLVTVTPLTEDFVFFGFLTHSLAERLLAALMAVGFGYINYRGAEETGRAEVVVVVVKLVILALFIVFGAYATFTNPDWPAKFLSNPSFAPGGVFGIIGAMGFTYIAFEGYEIIVQSGEEVKEPGKNVPKAVFYSLAVVVPIYVLVAFVVIGGIDVTREIAGMAGVSAGTPTWQALGGLGELGIVEAANQFMPYGALLLLVAGIAATSSALNATVYSSSRVSFAMGRNRELPAFFERIHPERRTPHIAILLSTVLIVAMSVTLPIESVAASADIMFILLFVQVNWALIRMRTTHPDLERTFTVPFMPWPALVGIVAQVVLLPFLIYELGLEAAGIGTSNEGLVALAVTAVWMVLGLAVFYGYSKGKRAEEREAETPTVLAEETPEERERRILVPLANPETTDRLLRTAIDLARERDAEIRVMSVVTVPRQTPVEEGRQFVDTKREHLEDAIGTAEAAGVPAGGTVRIGHDVAEAVIATAEEDDVDEILLGWRGRSRRRDFVLGSNVDRVATDAPCDVLVERIGPPTAVGSILVPTAGGPHAEYAAEVADALAKANDARVRVVSVVPPGASADDRERAERTVETTAALVEPEVVETDVVEGNEVVPTIVSLSADHDVTVVGASREGLLQRLVFGAIPEAVGLEADGTVIMAKRRLDLRSRLSRWFWRARNGGS
ncbi:amino acid permease [Halococcus hamelinensis]|uniref:Cationic amino acid transporter n=1 Tax=Halococcus hamelinensis 100A6 TaxID=1132509 RepID=M0M0N2_9EURY|nr:amino acid permease [Halococcus hamelinensis]EMA37935.1 cationic amino acid transporter [Halococcus hamelinensis 100A6]